MTQPVPVKNVPLTGAIIAYDAPMDNKPGRLYVASDDGPEVVLNIWPESVPLLTPLGDMTNAEGLRIAAVARYVETRGTEIRYRPSAITLLEAAPAGAAPVGAAPMEPTRPAPRAPRATSSMEEGMAKGNATTAAATGLFAPWMGTHGDLPPDEVCEEFARKLAMTANLIISGRQTETTTQPQDEPPTSSSVQRL
jgi:hypothetical protein